MVPDLRQNLKITKRKLSKVSVKEPADLLFATEELSPKPAEQSSPIVFTPESPSQPDAIHATPPGMPLCPPFNNSVPNSPEESASRERQRHTLPNFFRSRSAPVSPRNSAEPRQPRFQRR